MNGKVAGKLWGVCSLAACCALAAACEHIKIGYPAGGGGAEPGAGSSAAGATDSSRRKTKSAAGVDADFLLSMTWPEAKAISPQHLEIPPFYKVAADEIAVLKRDDAGRPRRVRAKGHVFMQVDFNEQLTSLGQEAYIEAGGELILRGKPLLKRGRSLVEGLTDMTVFYIKQTRLQVIGSHRLIRKPGGPTGTFSVEPNWTRSWQEGPNPILPALSPEDVPKEMRMNPLLPPLDGDEGPKLLPPGRE